MKVLVLGSGGREHAISWKISQSSLLTSLFIAPGNAGTASLGTNISLNPLDFDAITDFVEQEGIDMIVVGPEQPLVEGIADHFKGSNVLIVGPDRAGAMLEGSKAFSKGFMQRHNIPTARYASFSDTQLENALTYLEDHPLPVVIKASGLAAGKGVLICESKQEAMDWVRKMLSGEAFGTSGSTIVIEEFLKGIEISVFVLADGNSYKLLPSAKDYKRIGEGDTGLNTGGMGAVSPVSFADPDFIDLVDQSIVRRTLDGLRSEGITYKGFLFLGLMVVEGLPYLLEYNVRLGDPEAEVILPRLQGDFLQILRASAEGRLHEVDLTISPEACTTVMLVSGGYPGSYEKGKAISGIESVSNSIVFHSGTKIQNENTLTNGGRVLAITSLASDFRKALALSLQNADLVQFEGKYYRTDIGKDLMELS